MQTKRKLLFTAVVVCALFLITSCKKDKDEGETYSCTTCKSTPDAKAVNDASSKGIYKGVVIGSSGTITFDISNDNSTITAVLVLDGNTITLTSNVAWVSGLAYTAPFTGVFNAGNITVNFTVDANGQNATVTTSNIPGHPSASFTIIKETSNSLIECFEGTYSTTKPEAGIFNLIVSRTLKGFKGASRLNNTTVSEPVSGTINSNGELIDNGRVLATLKNDQITGKFVDADGHTVNVTGKRTY